MPFSILGAVFAVAMFLVQTPAAPVPRHPPCEIYGQSDDYVHDLQAQAREAVASERHSDAMRLLARAAEVVKDCLPSYIDQAEHGTSQNAVAMGNAKPGEMADLFFVNTWFRVAMLYLDASRQAAAAKLDPDRCRYARYARDADLEVKRRYPLVEPTPELDPKWLRGCPAQ